MFDASNAPGRKPIAFKLGARQVIKGWEEVLRLMNVREGGRIVSSLYVHTDKLVRRLVILRVFFKSLVKDIAAFACVHGGTASSCFVHVVL